MKNINIIYLLPELKGASGGAKVIYNHSLILNNLKKNLSSNVLHLIPMLFSPPATSSLSWRRTFHWHAAKKAEIGGNSGNITLMQ